jgi:hypothetical protein
MPPSSHVQLLTWGIGRSLTYLAVHATYVYVRTYVRYIGTATYALGRSLTYAAVLLRTTTYMGYR